MYKYRFIITFIYFFLGITLPLFAQPSSYLDSLIVESNQSEKDTNYINLLGKISVEYTYSDTEKAMETINEALQLSTKLEYPSGVAMSHDILGIAYFDMGKLDSSLYYYLKSLDYYKNTNDRLMECKLYNKILQVYTTSRNFEKAKEYSDLATALAENIDDYRLKGNTANGRASVYMDNAWDKLDKGDSVAFTEYFRKASPYLLQASTYFEQDGYAKGSALAFGNLAYVESSLGNYDKALDYSLRATDFFEKNNFKNYLSLSYNQICSIYINKNDYKKALIYAKKNLEISLAMGNPYDKHNAYDNLSKIYEKLGNYKQALFYKHKMYIASKEMFNIDKEEQISSIQSTYDIEKKEQENLLLKQQAELDKQAIQKQYTITVTVVIILLLVTILAFIAYRAYTIRKQAALKIEELNATQSRWFTNIAHELRTPLTLILGPLKNVLSSPNQLSTNEAKELEIAHKNAQQLLKLVNQILDISKMEVGQLSLDRKPINLSALVRQSTAFFSSYATYKHIELTTSIENDIYILADEEKIKNILINLISNALNFTHNKGLVTISVNYDEPKRFIAVIIKDTGDGISPDDLPNIFNRFYQAKNKGSLHQGGSGIGLALSMEFAKLHGGNITANSVLGKGSEFILELPMSLQCEEIIEEEQEVLTDDNSTISTSFGIRSSEKPNLLLVEDNPDMQEYISNSLKDGYHIVQAVDGVDALEKLKNYTPDLIISDVMMPRMDGLAFANKIKESSKFKVIPFITLTARADEEAKLEALRIGIDDYVVKPFNLEELKTRANNLLVNYKERKLAIEESKSMMDEEANLSYDEQLIQKLTEKVNEHIDDNSFSVKELADYASMSESTLHRTLKKVTGLTPGQFIREIKLQRALKLFELRTYRTISEVVYAVGFDNKTHFSKLFKNRFGKAPSEYLS